MSGRHYYDGENNSGHYNFVIVDRELVMVMDDRRRNVPSCLKLSLEALGLYVVIKAHAIDKNFAWPSLATLETLTGKDKKTILKYIKELVEKELIYVESMPNPMRPKGQPGHPINCYVIPAVEKEAIRSRSLALSGKFTLNPPES